MKMSKGKEKKRNERWQIAARRLPLELFHTTLGPIIGRTGRAEGGGQFRVRIWAPAIMKIALASGEDDQNDTAVRQRVVFQPIAFVESYFDLSVSTPAGRSPVPESIIGGYEEFFDKFAEGEYAIRRSVIEVVQEAPHESSETFATNGSSEPS
jgi:hypothetical protein